MRTLQYIHHTKVLDVLEGHVIASLVFMDLMLTVLTLKQTPHLENFDTEVPTLFWINPKSKSRMQKKPPEMWYFCKQNYQSFKL